MGRLAGLRLGGKWFEAACVLPACKRTASELQANCKRTAGVLPAYCQLTEENTQLCTMHDVFMPPLLQVRPCLLRRSPSISAVDARGSQ